MPGRIYVPGDDRDDVTGRIITEFDSIPDAISERRPSGSIIINGQEVANTLQCVHGGEHFISRRGSGVTRGFCMRCQGPTCGSPDHDVCIPFEKRLDEYEAGLRRTL